MADPDLDGPDDGTYDDEPAAPVEATVDADGYHIVSNRGKFAEQSNPLKLKLEAEKRKKEEREREAAKAAKMAQRAAAFGKTVAAAPKEEEKKTAVAAPAPAPDAARPVLDNRVRDMMRSGIATKTRGTVVLSRGRGRGGRGGGASGGMSVSVSVDEHTLAHAHGEGHGHGEAQEQSKGSDSDSSTERRAAARAKVAQDLSAAASKPLTSADEAGKARAANLIAQRRASRHSVMVTAAPAGAPAPARPTAASGLASITEARSQLLAAAAEVHSSQETDASAEEPRVHTSAPAAAEASAPAAGTPPKPIVAPSTVEEEVWSDQETSTSARGGHQAETSLQAATRRLSVMPPVHVAAGLLPTASLTYQQVLQVLRGDASSITAAGIDTARPEAWLTASEFKRVLEVDAATFASLPRWHQLALRKKAKLQARQTRVPSHATAVRSM